MPRPKSAVLIVVASETFRPTRPHDFPASIDSAELYARNITPSDAAGFARTFNKHQIASGLPDRRWAVPLSLKQANWLGVPVDGSSSADTAAAVDEDLAAEEGGAQ